MKSSEILDRTISILFEHGWTKGRFHNDAGEVCVRGALAFARGEEKIFLHTPYDREEHYIVKACPRIVGSHGWISMWNDHPDRTFDEVIEVLEKAKKLALIDEA